MCRNAARRLMSPLRAEANSHAVTPLTAMPTDCCNHHDGDAGDLARRDQAAHTLNSYRANRHQKEHGIGERGQNGAAPQTIGVSL